MTDMDEGALARVIWHTSRADESTISATGANIVARAVLASDWMKRHDAEVWDEGRRARPVFLGPDDGHYNNECMGWEDCYCGTYINPYRTEVSSD